MTFIIMPFLMSMFLGRTIDLRSYDIGGDLFDSEQYFEIPRNLVTTQYFVHQNNNFDLYSYVNIPVDVALRMKSGTFSSSSGHTGLTGFLRDTTWKQRSVIIAVVTAVQTVSRTLKDDAQPIKNWPSRIPKSQTHFTKSLMYGGWSIILYRLKCDIPGDVEIVRQIVTKNLGINGSLTADTITKWEDTVEDIRRNHEVRGSVSIDTHTYSSFLFKHDVSTFDGLMTAINEIPKIIGPLGKPVFMVLQPLNSLDESYPVVYENNTLEKQLKKIDSMYDDVRNTKNSLSRWVEESDASDEDETKISDFLEHLNACFKLFHKIATEASIYKNMDQNLLKKAVDLYNSQLSNYVYNYDRIFRRLKEEIAPDCQDTFHHKIKGLLEAEDTERIRVGEVEGGLEECKEACIAVPQCRSIGYIDKMVNLEKASNGTRSFYQMVNKEKICYVYFRSSSSSNVVPTIGATTAYVYDRMCK